MKRFRKNERAELPGSVRTKANCLAALLVLILAREVPCATAGEAAETNSNRNQLLSLSLEQLSALKVTSVSKKEESLSATAAAVSVITPEDIRRSGATTIPEALRLAPGVDVGRVDSHTWAVGVRGLNDTFSHNLLTLVDGRSVFSPLFSGTIWMAEDVMLEDMDRIEVVRGAGATISGANAFNGVINVVSKPASETQGFLFSGGSGSQQLAGTSARYGGKIDDNTFYRVYAKYDNWDNFEQNNGTPANDAWWKVQGGFRLDHGLTEVNKFTLQGDVYDLSANNVFPQASFTPPYNFAKNAAWKQTGGNLLGRWTHEVGDNSEWSLQAYYDGEVLDNPLVHETRNTFDLALQDEFHWGTRQQIVWGGGYRLNASALDGTFELSFVNPSTRDTIYNTFIQDEIALVPERLQFTLGTKLEHNNFTGLEFEPGARLAWTPSDQQTVWASISRAVRTPSQLENSALIHLAYLPASAANPAPTLIEASGSPNFKAEELTAYELGYRLQPDPRLSFDATAFVQSYRHLGTSVNSIDTGTLLTYGYVTVDAKYANVVSGETYGTEITSSWQALDNLRLTGNYSLLESSLHAPLDPLTGAPAQAGTAAPVNQASLRASVNVTKDIDLDMFLRYSGKISNSGSSAQGSSLGPVASYVSMDLRLAWRPTKHLELSLVGLNLLENQHREFNPTFISYQTVRISRSIFAKVTVQF